MQNDGHPGKLKKFIQRQKAQYSGNQDKRAEI